MNNGIRKRLDKEGKLYIPSQIRKNLNLTSNDFLVITVENEKIILEKADTNFCFKCNNKAKLIKYKNSLICENCFNDLAVK
ncbi:stationary/sporulation gene regulator,transcriptional regulator, AbrB family [[Clostridium] sordellii]|uniref:AbrB/MazE/SpoVT family DNA-binding domain-containing protein n=1 Tax=Paraclostridium sordellii TaxID=1505 RepID=UPI00054449DE|nr:AbrB/MazE/SpoVT family DNA-binding domain-containing protein [Paeniclostridium sordellii]CEK34497.1 stationary/sporulation gene regulator,transcriptional regulator, AbrB family [[Clostridium] sordellii] [Paeniclostridium sordellii]